MPTFLCACDGIRRKNSFFFLRSLLFSFALSFALIGIHLNATGCTSMAFQCISRDHIQHSYLVVRGENIFPFFHWYSDLFSWQECARPCVCVWMNFDAKPFTQWKLLRNVRVIVSYFMAFSSYGIQYIYLQTKWLRMRFSLMCVLVTEWDWTLVCSHPCEKHFAQWKEKKEEKKRGHTSKQASASKQQKSMQTQYNTYAHI